MSEEETKNLDIDENLFEDGAIPLTEEKELKGSNEENVSESIDAENKSSQT